MLRTIDQLSLAEGMGFEPTKRSRVYLVTGAFSHSATPQTSKGLLGLQMRHDIYRVSK